MNKNTLGTIFILVLIVLGFLYWIPTEWTRRMITVHVVDAQTGEPIEGAIVFFDWFRNEGLPGLFVSVDLESKEGLTDSQGDFRMPKFSFAHYRMAAYKKGYVCWSHDWIFYEDMPRKGFYLRHGAVIKLERFQDNYSRKKHVDFMIAASIGNEGGRLFDEAIRAEEQMAAGKTGDE